MSGPATFLDGKVTLHAGDSLDVLKGFAEASIDAIVTDPPYGIAFMGRGWDTAGPEQRAFNVRFWRECLRVLKPGGHLLAFSANRTVHRMTCAIEDAGFEIRDLIWEAVAADAQVSAFMESLDDAQRSAFIQACENSTFGGMLAWVFGSGFPKGGDLAKLIDKHLGVTGTFGEPKSAAHAGWINRGAMRGDAGHEGYQRPWMDDAEAVSNAARRYHGGCEQSRPWEGFGIALKPALEPITMARKPLAGTVVETVLAHGTGALNIDGCRIGGGELRRIAGDQGRGGSQSIGGFRGSEGYETPLGRFPANLITDGSEDVVAAFPAEAGAFAPVRGSEGSKAADGSIMGLRERVAGAFHSDGGSAARFFYQAKADALDRLATTHPTVKPLDLMRYLVRLVTPPGGTVLDPFAGTGTTGEAAFREGMLAVLIEREEKYRADIATRMGLAVSTLAARRAVAVRAKAERAGDKPRPASDAFDLFG